MRACIRRGEYASDRGVGAILEKTKRSEAGPCACVCVHLHALLRPSIY